MRVSNDVWLDILSRSVTSEVSFESVNLPGFPSEELQHGTGAFSGVVAIRQAWEFVNGVTERFETSALFARTDKRLLDFGTAWGRISRCFLRDFERANIIGMDVNPELI